jgi:putative ABC transport system ATP-binding protein
MSHPTPTDLDQQTVAGLEVLGRDLHVSYDGHEVLRGVDLQVGPGQLVAVTGPSGAGKTTLLWTLAGLVAPEHGEVSLDGEPPRDRDHTCELGVVLLPQDNALATVLTAAENVLVPLLGARVPPDEAHARTTAALKAVGLDGAGDQLVEELSGGQQQRVAVARGLAQRGRVVLADEPTSETHDPDAAAACDAELHLDDGVGTWVRRCG